MILGAETVIDGAVITADHVAIYDDDHYYMGPVLALELRRRGHRVSLITPQGRVCAFGDLTEEQMATAAGLIEAGVDIVTNRTVEAVLPGVARTACVFTGRVEEIRCDAVLPLTRRLPLTGLFDVLSSRREEMRAAGIETLARIGDTEAPSIIAEAVYAGYHAAAELGEAIDPDQRYARRERPLAG